MRKLKLFEEFNELQEDNFQENKNPLDTLKGVEGGALGLYARTERPFSRWASEQFLFRRSRLTRPRIRRGTGSA